MYLKKITLLIACIILASCQEIKHKASSQNTNPMLKKFYWKPTECAPKHYPVSIYQGSFIMENGDYATVPKGGTVANGWGSSGSSWAVGDDVKPIPVRLKIIWISYAENQFYYGDFELPQQKMIDLFEKGYVSTLEKKETYDNIAVGLAPGGSVSVWLLGGGATVEVGHYQAKKTEVAMADFKPNAVISLEEYVKDEQEHFSEETKQVIAKEGIPIGKWSGYRQRYLWMPKVSFEKEGTLASLLSESYNGELYSVLAAHPLLASPQNYPPPKFMAFKWYDANKYKYGCRIYFDESEIWDAYKTLFKKPETKKVDMLFHVDKYNSNIRVRLASETDTIAIEKAEIKVFETSD